MTDKEFHRLQFLVDTGSEHIKKKMEISLQTGELAGVKFLDLKKSISSTWKNREKAGRGLQFCPYPSSVESMHRVKKKSPE